MRTSVGIGLLLLGVMVPVLTADAQERQRATPQRAQLRAVETTQPTLRDALADESVRAALSTHVRRLDMDRLAAQYDAASIGPLIEGTSDDAPLRRMRLLNDSQLEELGNVRRRSLRSRADTSTTSRVARVENIGPVAVPNAGNARSVVRRSVTPPSRVGDITTPPPGPTPPGSSRGDIANPAPGPTRPPRSNVGDLAAPPQPYLDVQGFADDLHAALQNSVVGYEMRMRRNDQTIYTLQWNWAQNPADDGLAWSQNRRMHIVSMSKFITMMGLTRLLDANNIDFDDSIAPYLPDYWQQGPGVQNVTFADLMNHQSGFDTNGSSDGSFALMKAQVAAGASNPGTNSGYENMNFALCRILIATIGNYIDTSAQFGDFNDMMWDMTTIGAYTDYIESNVFAPAGVNGPTLGNPSNGARAYQWNDNNAGWDSGNLMGQAGGVAWHMSPDELLSVIGTFRRGGNIVSQARAREVFDASYGLNSSPNGNSSDAGRYYFKPGKWTNGSSQTEQGLLMILPEQIEVVIFVSSQIGPGDQSLQTLGATIYENNIIVP